jgi:DNA helicase II / ATP-dependent DNA helicase PcrA
MEPTLEQQRIIRHYDGPLLILAVAGAGKTTSLLWLIWNLIYRGVPVERILMATFSKRAALDMAGRAKALGVPPGVRYRTLHSVGFEMIRCEDATVTVPKGYKLVRVVRDELREIEKEQREGSSETLPKPGDVLKEIGRAKAALIWPGDGGWETPEGFKFPSYIEWAMTRQREPIPTLERAVIYDRCYRRLEEVCREPAKKFPDDPPGRWVTFDDQLALPARSILRRRGGRDEWVRDWRGRFARVLVDEVQDNNLAQWTCCEFLAENRNLICVGDDQQSIYGFRGAQPGLMRDFVERHGAGVLPLSFNWRSGQKILDVANRVLEHARDRLYVGQLQRGRAPDAVGDVFVTHYDSQNDEAHAVVAEIEELLAAKVDPTKIVVLYRINAQSGALEMALIRRGIRYKVAGSSFFSRGEIRAAIGYLAVALDETDEQGFDDSCNVPTRYLGRAFLEKFPSLARARSAMGSSELGRWLRGVAEYQRALRPVKARLEAGETPGALRFIFEDLKVRQHFRDEGSDEDDETEVDEATRALIHASITTPDPRELIRFARDMQKTGREDFDDTERRSDGRVTLSTIHKAKALEWENVFIVGCNAGLFPLDKAPLAEERRLFYVGVTRARDRLMISWSNDPPSRFLLEGALIEEEHAPEPEKTDAVTADTTSEF